MHVVNALRESSAARTMNRGDSCEHKDYQNTVDITTDSLPMSITHRRVALPVTNVIIIRHLSI